MGRLEKFLSLYTSKSTKTNYRWALRNFFKSVYGKTDNLEELAETYFQEKRNVQDDVNKFLVSLNGRPPKSIGVMVPAVKTFLLENDVELSQKFWRRIRGRVRGSRALTLDKVPSNEEFRKILQHMPIQGRALFLTLSSSGMRIGEALQLTLDDVDLDADPVRVYIRGEYTKTGNPRTTFISSETRQTIRQWLNVHDEYLDAAARKSHLHEKSKDDPRMFPFNHVTSYAIWNNALKKTKLSKRDKSTNRRTVHPHVLRKFFRTKLGSVIPVDVVEALMGHERYLTEVYRRYTVEDLAELYKQGEHALLIFTEAGEVSELRKEVEEQRDQLQTIVNGLTAENLELKSRVARTELTVTKLEKHIESLESTVKRIRENLEKVAR